MASRNWIKPDALQRGLVIIAGSFAPNDSSAISADSRQGTGWSVARSNTGLYTVTFSDKYAALVSFGCWLQLATPAAQVLCAGVYTAASKTITITNFTSGSAADIAADANNRIHFAALFRNSEAVPARGA